MGKTVSVKKSFTFIGGLNTEAGPLTFPPNVWADGVNVVPYVDGSLNVRPAINYETDYALSAFLSSATLASTGAWVCGEWNAAGGSGGNNFVVVQRGDTLHFYTNSGDGVSPEEKAQVVYLSLYKVPGNPNPVGVAPCSFSNANGKLLVTSSDTYPILLTYVPATDTITVAIVTISIRDLYGVDDGLAVNASISTMTLAHKYNLFNQGWTDTQINAMFASVGLYPSNAQVWTAGKDSSDNFDVSLLLKQDFGTTPAAKGRFVLNAFNRNRDAVSGIPAGLVETDVYYPTTNAFFAGRAWYAGMRSATLGTWVMFSQVADTPTKYGNCYQEADPTSEFISDLVAADGGVIPIQDAGNIIALKAAYNSMLVFADNGVWQISGGVDTGFSATAYDVRKLSSAGCIGAQSIVEAENNVFYWSSDGVWRVAPTQAGTLEVTNTSNLTIHTLYTGIPLHGKTYASGRYHAEDKKVYWLYNDQADQDGVDYRFKKTSMLVLDLRIPSYYRLSVSALSPSTPYITDLVITKIRRSTTREAEVVDAADAEVMVGGDNVVATLTPTVLKNSDVRFLTVVPSGLNFTVTFSSFDEGLVDNYKFKDWYSFNNAGTTYSAYILSGFDMGNNQGGDKSIQGLYITCFLNRTETGVDSLGEAINESSCILTSRWDWSDNAIAGKWGAGQEVYRHRRPFFPSVPSATFNDGYPVVVTKNKIRGRGKAIQLKFENTPGKDMQLLGWSITYLGNENV